MSGIYLQHVSLVSGRCCIHRLDLLEGPRIAEHRQLLAKKDSLPGLPGYSVKSLGEMITIFRGSVPVILCAVGKGRTQAWSILEVVRETFGMTKVKPPEHQWLATVELPALRPLPMREVFRLIDCERYLAYCLLSPPFAADNSLREEQ